MLQARENERIRACRALRAGLVFATLLLVLAGPAATPAGAIFRAFSRSSPWNVTAVPTAPSNPFAGGFADSPGFTMKLSGTPDNITHGSPVFFAASGDPTAPVSITQPDWTPKGKTKWDGKPVPVPIGVAPAPGTDGHLTVVSARKDVAWEFFGCTQAGAMGYVTKVIVQWDLTGPGYSTEWENTSARGSGMPLISTSLRADEALRGIQHALGITVPRVSADYVFPAAHSDGRQGPGAIKYGMRFVLRPDYPVPPNASIGVQNVIYALKIYGAYVSDQGADFVMDADYTRPELWQQAGITSYKTFNFTGADLLPAKEGIPPPLPEPPAPVRESVRGRAVVLRVKSRRVWLGGRLQLRGKVNRHTAAGARVQLEIRVRKGWHRLRLRPIAADGTFTDSSRLQSARRASGDSGSQTMRLRSLDLGRNVKKLELRAVVPGVGRSNVVRVGVRR
jgi:hypothetical protein